MIRWLVTLTAAATAALLFEHVEARPGGGHGYSGGGSSSSGGGGGNGGSSGGGEIIYLLVRLILYRPAIGVPIAVVVVGGWIWVQRSHRANRVASWDSAQPLAPVPLPSTQVIRALDAEFSQVLFEDFLFRLYREVHSGRNPTGLATLTPYLSDNAAQELLVRQPANRAADSVVVGALHLSKLNMPPKSEDGRYRLVDQDDSGNTTPSHITVAVDFESNLSYSIDGEPQTLYVREQWWLSREAAVQSKGHPSTRALGCPNCGGPFTEGAAHTCSHCQQVVNPGRFDWTVTHTSLRHTDVQPPALGGYAEEVGTYDRTLVAADLSQALAHLHTEDSGFSDQAFGARLTHIFHQLNTGWVAGDIGKIRPYVSDGLLNYFEYWLSAYRSQGLQNRLDDMVFSRWEWVKVVRDKRYDAITVRFWAQGKDFTVASSTGKVVGGSRSHDRQYSEYWTLIRGATVRGQARSDAACPNCGAELTIAMVGNCVFCGTYITAGEFDWVLSKIEQDEAYRG